MIVKNEESHLARCLDSVCKFVDEIIIVDTGSTDTTKEIAHRYTRQVFDFEWKQDFSSARNASIQHASGKWIMFLDADEYLDPLHSEDLLSFLGNLKIHNPTGIILPVYNYVGDINSGKISESKAMRIFNNHQSIRFHRPIHEQLHCPIGSIQSIDYHFPIYHTGYLQKNIEIKGKSSRNMAIFEAMLQQGDLSCYDWFTLGNEYTAQNKHREALECYIKANRPSEEGKIWLPLCVGGLINCCIQLNKYGEAFQYIKSSQQHWPHSCDFYWLEGFLLAKLGLDDLAIHALNTCLQLADSEMYGDSIKVLISPNNASSLPLQQLTVLYLRNFSFNEAVATLSKLIYVTPNNKTLLKEFIQILISFHQTEGIANLLQSFYPDPQSFQRLMILEVCMELGLRPLSETYRNQIKQLPIEVPARLELLYCILFENKELFDKFSVDLSLSFIDADIKYMYTLICGEGELGSHIEELDVDTLSQIYKRFFYAQQFNHCDTLVNQHSSPLLLNAIADTFFQNRQYELALDYYSMLLNQDALAASGYENIGRLYITQGDIADGLEYVRKASELNPANIALQMLVLNQTTELADQGHVKQAIIEQFPGLIDFPLI